MSVNPNGPLHVGHGRYAAYGDALHRLMAFSGAKVATEFYINDYGRQMDRFGRSVAARYAQSFGVDLPVPDDGYQGEYVKDVAADHPRRSGGRLSGRPDPRGERGRSGARGFAGRAGGGADEAAKEEDRRRGRGRGGVRLAGRPGRGGSGHVLPQAGLRAHARGDARGTRVLRRGVRHVVQRDHPARGRGARAGRRRLLARRGLRRGRRRLAADHLPRRRQRPGAHPQPTAARPTSPRTSPTTRTSWSGASSTSSTSGAPTTTATCRG